MFMTNLKLKDKILFFTVIFVGSLNGVHGQKCSLIKAQNSCVNFRHYRLIDSLYSQFNSDTTGQFHFLLVRKSGEVRDIEVIHLVGDKNDFIVELGTNDSALRNETLEDNTIITILKGMKNLNGYYCGECNNWT